MKVVRVEWIDAALHAEWTDTQEEANLVPIDTVGFLLNEDARVIKVAQSVSASKRFSAIQSIPSSAVIRVVTLSANRIKKKGRG